MKLVDLLRNLNIDTPEFVLSQLLEHKLYGSGDTEVDVVVLIVRVVFGWLFGLDS